MEVMFSLREGLCLLMRRLSLISNSRGDLQEEGIEMS